jgi:hypothetical protein
MATAGCTALFIRKHTFRRLKIQEDWPLDIEHGSGGFDIGNTIKNAALCMVSVILF